MSGARRLERRTAEVTGKGARWARDEEATMSDFVFLFRSDEAGVQAAMGTPERAQQSMQAWMAWIRDLEAKGHLKNRGQPLERTGKVVRKHVVTDGPYAEAKDMIMGYIIVEAADLTQAATIAAGCPMVTGGGGGVEIRPVMTSPF
jgi:hypothetical protein